MLNNITPVILTYNEAPNIARTLDKLGWARNIVVVDSFSTDRTVDIINNYNNTSLFQRVFDNHAAQWNFAISETGISTDWVLALDADYVLTDKLTEEIGNLAPTANCAGYEVDFNYCIFGRPLRGTLYPKLTILFRKTNGWYRQCGHTQRLEIDGKVRSLNGRVLHDDRKPLARWLASQQKYASLEAEYLTSAPVRELRTTDRLRRLGWIMPVAILPYLLIVKRGMFDGCAGWAYALQRLYAETLIALEVVYRLVGQKGEL
jgi:glycosyltransferase involved in cell wall biosynthesis